MHILVTGSSGFIGRRVVETAVDEGYRVSGLDLVAQREQERGDVRLRADVERAMRGVDAVIHLAARVGLERDFGDSPEYVDHNGTGTAVVLSAAARAGVSTVVTARSGSSPAECETTCIRAKNSEAARIPVQRPASASRRLWSQYR